MSDLQQAWGSVLTQLQMDILRRRLVLLGIGIIHAFLIWMGDILVLYALLGFPLILYRKVKSRTLLVWMVLLLTLPLLFTTAATLKPTGGCSANCWPGA